MPISQLTLRAAKPKPHGYPNQAITLGEHLRKRRLDLGLLQRELAVKLGAHKASVLNWELGRNDPELRFMPAILAFLGFDPRPAPNWVGARLVRHREVKGWTQNQLASALGVDPTTLSRWELGKKTPWGVYLERVNRLLTG